MRYSTSLPNGESTGPTSLGVKGGLGLDLDTHQAFNPAQGKCSIDMDPGYLPTSQALTPSPSLVRALKQFAILSTL